MVRVGVGVMVRVRVRVGYPPVLLKGRLKLRAVAKTKELS